MIEPAMPVNNLPSSWSGRLLLEFIPNYVVDGYSTVQIAENMSTGRRRTNGKADSTESFAFGTSILYV